MADPAKVLSGNASYEGQLMRVTAHSATAPQEGNGHCGGLGQQIWPGGTYRWLQNTPASPYPMSGKEKEHER